MPDEPTPESTTALLRRLGFSVAVPATEPAGLHSDPRVLAVVPAGSEHDGEYDVVDRRRIASSHADRAGAVAEARRLLGAAGGGQVRVYGALHLVEHAVGVRAAPTGEAAPGSAPVLPTALDDRSAAEVYRWVRTVGTATAERPGFPAALVARANAVPPAGPSLLDEAGHFVAEVVRFLVDHHDLVEVVARVARLGR